VWTIGYSVLCTGIKPSVVGCKLKESICRMLDCKRLFCHWNRIYVLLFMDITQQNSSGS
jgi:hypothetical protein